MSQDERLRQACTRSRLRAVTGVRCDVAAHRGCAQYLFRRSMGDDESRDDVFTDRPPRALARKTREAGA